MKNTPFDTESVTRSALFGGVDSWYDTYWLGQRSAKGRRHINKVTRCLQGAIVAIRAGYPALCAHMRELLAIPWAAAIPTDLSAQRRTNAK